MLGKVPAEIYKNAKKIYPIRRVEIRKIELLQEPKAAELKPAVVEAVA